MKLYVERRHNSAVLERDEWLAKCQACCIPAGKSPWYLLNRRMCGAQRRPRPDSGEEIILNTACQPHTRFHSDHSYYAILGNACSITYTLL